MMTKRLSLSLLTVALIATLVAGASFALFSATTSNVGNTFTAGTVTLNQPVNTLINLTNLAPGDSGNAGSFEVTYTGNLEAWLGLTATKTGAIFEGANPLNVTISDGTATYVADGSTKVVGTAPVATGAVKTFTVSYDFPLAADNTYQAATGSVSLQVKAVQARNNTTGNGPTSWQ